MRPVHATVAGGVALAYSGCFVAIELGLGDAPPLRFAGLRAALAGGALLFVAGAVGRERVPPPRLRPWLPALAAVLTAQYVAMFLSPGLAGAGLSAVLANTGPIFLVVLAVPALGETFHRLGLAAIAMGATGVGLIAWRGGEAGEFGAWGLVLPLVVAMAAALETILLKRASPGRHLLALAGWQLLLASAPLLLLSAVVGEAPIDWTPSFIGALGFVALPGTAMGLTLWYWLVQREPVSRLAAIMFLVPVAGLLLAWLILGETISGRQAAGLVTALAGILLATTSEDPGDAGPEPAARSGDAP